MRGAQGLLLLLLLLVTSLQSSAVRAAGILFPRASETRELRQLDGVWDFKLSPPLDQEIGFKDKWFSKPLQKDGSGDVLPMPVPASFNDITGLAGVRDFVGWAWYQRSFFVPTAWLQRHDLRVRLRFGSVHYYAKVWLNGVAVTEHEGGHLPFEADVTSYLRPRRANLLTVAVNNTLHAHTVPQGQVTWTNDTDSYPPGYVIYSYTFDFFNYAGIHRPVYLHVTPATRVDDITLTTELRSTAAGVVRVVATTEASPDSSTPARCMVRVLDAEDQAVASTSVDLEGPTCNVSLTVENPKLWWPARMRPNPGYLYTLEVKLVDDDSSLLDVYRLPFGIRTICFNSSSIFVNGESFYFRGMGRHEDTNIRGKGWDLPTAVKDHNLMTWLGANSYRTSHYPYSEESLDLADRLGFVVVSESPAVNLEVFDKRLLARHLAVMRELVRRDKNRACVLFWSLANEPRSQQNASEQYFKELSSYVKFLDPTRPITAALNQRYDLDHAGQFLDVLAVNRYFAWYSDTGRLELINHQMQSEVRNWKSKHNKPLFISEYGADAIAGLHSDPPSLWTEDYQAALMRENFKAFDTLRAEGLLNGEMIWNFADFATAQVYTRVDGNKKGLFTRERTPKAAAHVLRDRYHQLARQLERNFDNDIN